MQPKGHCCDSHMFGSFSLLRMAVSARLISLRNQFITAQVRIHAVAFLHLLHTVTAWIVELHRIYIIRSLRVSELKALKEILETTYEELLEGPEKELPEQ